MNYEDYTVGIICAIATEFAAACALLDKEHTLLPRRSHHDDNAYTLGEIGDHNVVIATLPSGKYGIASAAVVAKDMLHSFPFIRIGLMVGIGGGAPTSEHDIRLGDVVVGRGILQYGYGKAIQGRKFKIKGSLNSPPTELLTALSKLEANHKIKGHQIAQSVSAMIRKNPRMKTEYECPGTGEDRLFEAESVHAHDNRPCNISCNSSAPPIIERRTRTPNENNPAVHYGRIASSDMLMKDAKWRDTLANEHDVLCFEMEAAGLTDNFPCVVIRGICDYSDTHKNDMWQGYAAAVAASYAGEFLRSMPSWQFKITGSLQDVNNSGVSVSWLLMRTLAIRTGKNTWQQQLAYVREKSWTSYLSLKLTIRSI